MILHNRFLSRRVVFIVCFALMGLVVLKLIWPEQRKSFSIDAPSTIVPRFVSIGKEKAYARTGPALRYPIRWVYEGVGLPVEVIQEFDTWRKVRDIDQAEGWVHQNLLSSRRFVIVDVPDQTPLYDRGAGKGRAIALIEPRVIAKLERCDSDGIWCRIEIGNFRGWIERKHLWGIYAHEKLH